MAAKKAATKAATKAKAPPAEEVVASDSADAEVRPAKRVKIGAAKTPAREKTACALTIAGLDPGGGAGIAADLRAFHRAGVFGCAALAVTTVQSTNGIISVRALPSKEVIAQIDEVVGAQNICAVKTGALGSAANVKAVAAFLHAQDLPWVVDPVMVASRGDAALLDKSALSAMRDALIPGAALVTANVPEAEALTGITIKGLEDALEAAGMIVALGARAAMVKGGHMTTKECVDLIVTDDGSVFEHATPRLPISKLLHGRGCALAALITARLARGDSLKTAITWSKRTLLPALEDLVDVGGKLRVIVL